jgi:hypothetical protein
LVWALHRGVTPAELPPLLLLVLVLVLVLVLPQSALVRS